MSKFFVRMRAASLILLPGGIAAAIVLRTLAVYWGRDWLASGVILAIALALAIGLAELLARQLRLAQLERELRALPRTPDETTVDTAGPQLSVLLRARLEHQPLPQSNDGMAPFLAGLLVMLGLLGTLLGLFQTLQGAGHALTSSADLDALRRGLSAPIAGLTRSFGCAAAGISASAMLGLASALLRRRELRVLRAVYAYATGPLRFQAASARQLRAIEKLANQGSALPDAASAFERAGEKLSELSGALLSLQKSALETQQQGFRELFADVRRELSKAAADTGAALQAQVTPLLERDAARRRSEATEALEALRARLDEAESARAAAHAKELATLTSLHAHTLTDAERREQAIGARWQELVERLDAQLAAARETEAERLRSLDAQVRAAQERDVEHAATLARGAAELHGELARLSSELGSELTERRAYEQRHAEHVEQVFSQLSAASAAVERGIERQEGAIESLAERVSPLFEQAARRTTETAEHALDRLERSAQLLEDTIERQGGALEGLVERVSAVLPELASAAQAGAVTTLERLTSLADAQATRLTQLEAALARERTEQVRALTAQLDGHADALEERLARTSSAVEEAAAVWRASTVEMQAVAELFATSVERQREAAEAWLESLGGMESAVESAGRDAASDALSEQLASTQELFARQLQFQRELLTQLRTLRGVPSKPRSASGGQDVSPGE